MEEVGELAREALAFNNHVRKEKQKNHNKESLSNEFADVLITTLLLDQAMDVDVKIALENKIKTINKRFDGY